MDYNHENELTKQFFATVQNKLHFAAHGHTAAELRDCKKGKILPSDVNIDAVHRHPGI